LTLADLFEVELDAGADQVRATGRPTARGRHDGSFGSIALAGRNLGHVGFTHDTGRVAGAAQAPAMAQAAQLKSPGYVPRAAANAAAALAMVAAGEICCSPT
jgi:hypothetical protein